MKYCHAVLASATTCSRVVLAVFGARASLYIFSIYSPTMEREDSDDSLNSRLRMASLNSNLNRFLKYVDPPKTNATDIRSALKTPRDEEESLKASACSGTPALLQRHIDTPEEQEQSSNNSQSDPSTSSAQMDRKLRQNKPRLLLMGQRR